MVLQRRLDYGFNGYEVPPTPRATRSPRKSAFKKNQISSFDLLAAVAGDLLESGGNSSSSSNNAIGDGNEEDQCAVKTEPLYGGVQKVVEERNCDHIHDNNAERRFFVSEILPKTHGMESFDRSPPPPKDFHFGSTSGVTSDSSEKLGTQELGQSVCFRSETNDKISMHGRLTNNCEPELTRNVVAEDKHHIGSCFKKPIPPLVCSDDGENFSARYTTKTFRSTLRIGDRKIKKVLASKYCKVSSKQKDTTVTNSDLDLKPSYYNKKPCLKSLRSERRYPIKKRRYFDGYTASQSEETPKKGFMSTIACQKQPALQSRDSHVKLGIKSFKVPELFIEIPETATVGSLKRTVLEAVTTILEGGLRIGVLVHGKKVRDDSKMLLQSGISLDTLSDTLGFCLEPNPPQSTKPLSPEDSDCVRPFNVPHSLTRCLASQGKHAKPSNSDKWKTLVHTARISPQQRRGEPVPQELLDRVLMAHAYWSQQQGKQQLLEGPHKLETSLGL
ncbi:hypothetical protein Bca4012_069962 [Brassica carinata]